MGRRVFIMVICGGAEYGSRRRGAILPRPATPDGVVALADGDEPSGPRRAWPPVRLTSIRSGLLKLDSWEQSGTHRDFESANITRRWKDDAGAWHD